VPPCRFDDLTGQVCVLQSKDEGCQRLRAFHLNPCSVWAYRILHRAVAVIDK